MQRAHDLKPVFDPGKLPRDPCADLVRDKSLGHGKGCQIVEHVMFAGNADLGFRQNGPLLSPADSCQNAFPEIRALGDSLPVGKVRDARFGKALVIGRVRVVRVQDQAAVFGLIDQDFPLCVDIILKILMLIQVVRREIRDHRDIRAAVHTVKLEGAELEDDDIIGPHVRDLAQERIADVAAEVHAITGLF